MYATLNCTCFLAYFGAFCGWGYLVGGRQGRPASRPAIGIACCAIVSTLCFECGLSVAAIGRLIFGVAAMGAAVWVTRRPRGSRLKFRDAAVPLAAAFLLVAPMAIGGAQFALFQGNVNDEFNYLASAVARITETHSSMVAATPADFLRNPLLQIAHTMAGARPSVVDLYAGLEGLLPGNLHRCRYGFMCALLLATFFSVSDCLRCLAGGERWRAQLIALAYVVGFWGQFQIDIDSWSWAAATPVGAAWIGLVAGLPVSASGAAGGGPDWRSRFALGVCTAGLAYLYPEMFAFLGPAMGLALVIAAAMGRNTSSLRRNCAWATWVAAVLLSPKLVPIARFVAHQVSFSSTANFSPLDWMWQSMVGGPLAGVGPFTSALRWAAGSAGLGWLMDSAATRTFAILLACAAFGAAAYLARGLRRLDTSSCVCALGAATLMLEVALCAVLGRRWIAAKAMSYDSILVLPLLLAPAATGRISLSRAPAWILVCVQVAFGIYRPVAARDADGIHYRLPYYPAVMDPALKTARRWDVGEGPQFLHASRRVKIDVPDLWLETYAAISVQSQGLPYFKGLPVYIYLGISDSNYGTQVPAADFDSLVYLDYDRTAGHSGLGFARRDGEVYSAHPRDGIVRIQSGGKLDTTNGLLSWQMRPGGATAVTRISAGGPLHGSFVFEVGLISPVPAKGTCVLDLQSGTQRPVEVNVAGFGMDAIQGVSVPLSISDASESIVLTLKAVGASNPGGYPVTLVNPRLWSPVRPPSPPREKVGWIPVPAPAGRLPERTLDSRHSARSLPHEGLE
jgi:hypothetical protein